MRTAVLLAAGVLVPAVAAGPAVGQPDLAGRAARFEAAWEAADAAGRARAAAALRPATGQFLTFRPADAARTVDRARRALSPTPPPPAAEWLEALAAVPDRRLVDASARTVRVTVRPFYDVPGGPPPGSSASLRSAAGPAVDVPLGALPVAVDVPLSAGGRLALRVSAPGFEHTTAVPVAMLPGLADRRRRWRESGDGPTLEPATARTHADRLLAAAAGPADPNLPLGRFAWEFDAIGLADRLGVPLYRPGFAPPGGPPDQFWLTVPTAGGKATPVRFYLPPDADRRRPVPVVVGLHGLGGSEDQFFDGYGAGCVLKACRARGWALLSPRGGGVLGGSPPVPDLVAALADRFPLDPARVFLVGHSLGAAQAVDLAQKHPGQFAGLAVLGGAGRVKNAAAFAGLPTVVAVGADDFAKPGAEQFHRAIGGGPAADRITYPGVEHTLVVRAAVADVFRRFDAAGPMPRNTGGKRD